MASPSSRGRSLTPDDILKPAAAATLLKCATSTLRNWVSQRRVPFIKDGGRVLFSKMALLEHLAKKAQEPLV